MRGHHEITIKDKHGEEHKYTTLEHGALVSFSLHSKISRVIGRGVGEMFNGLGIVDGKMTISGGGSIGKGIELLFERIEHSGGVGFLMKILEHTTRDGKKMDAQVFDSAYRGNLGEMYEALLWVVKVNWEDLFERIPSLLASMKGTSEAS